MNYWLMKSEPDVFSFEDLKRRPHQKEPWNGVRNYQARNFMRDQMEVGDLVLFYHSSCPVPGICGMASVDSSSYPDKTQFDADSDYFDPRAERERPIWFLVDIKYQAEFKTFVSLEEMRRHEALSKMKLLQKGNRLSILPVTPEEFLYIKKLGSL